jgi:hypothetical protein
LQLKSTRFFRERAELGAACQGRYLNDRIGLLPHGTNKEFHDASVELRIRAALQFSKRFFRGARLFVGTIAGDGVVSVGDRDDP